MSEHPENVDRYIEVGCGRCEFGGTDNCKVVPWRSELKLLREIVLGCELSEHVKWGAPCYSNQGKNILMLSAFRSSAILSFFRGSELSDPEAVLEKPGEHSRFARYIKFTSTREIRSLRPVLQRYIQEAITLEQSGAKANVSPDVKLKKPQELNRAFDINPGLKHAFEALTPGRQRGYLIYFSSAKQSATRMKRIAKCTPQIFKGKGWNER